MLSETFILFLILAMALAGFITGIIRYDLVALLALLAAVLTGLVEPRSAFAGFGHPAVITVAAVLVVSRALAIAGLVGAVTGMLARVGSNTTIQVLALTSTVAVLSAFMNNVGALALLLPVAVTMARKAKLPPSIFLMPLAFGSILGGLTTLIGTPPNIIVSEYRAARTGEAYGLFSYTPVGAGIAVAGIVFIGLIGWRLLPRRKGQSSAEELFDVEKYLAELEVGEKSKAVGMTLREVSDLLEDPLPLIAVLRGKRRMPTHSFHGVLRAGDHLLVEAETEEIKELAKKAKLDVAGSSDDAKEIFKEEDLRLVEGVVQTDSILTGRTVQTVRLLNRYGLRLLAVARQGRRLQQRLRDVRFQAGDVILLQAGEESMGESLAEVGCLPLADRDIRIGPPRKLYTAIGIFAGGILLMLTGLLPVAPALVLVAVTMILVGILNLREAYGDVDLPVIVLLGAMIPVGEALETTGGAELLTQWLLSAGAGWAPVVTLIVLMVVTMFLSDVINNAAAAVLLAPIGFQVAEGLGVSPDPFLMAVAIGASCAFLTPIGHQSNLLVMGPGGYRFSDYFRMGAPIEVIVVVVSVPLLLWIWPL